MAVNELGTANGLICISGLIVLLPTDRHIMFNPSLLVHLKFKVRSEPSVGFIF